MAIFNCTPHSICIYKEKDVDMSNPRRLFVKDGAEPHVILEPCGTVLNAQVERVIISDTTGDIDVPLVSQKFTGLELPTRVPDATPNDYFIVSAFYKTAFNAVYRSHDFRLLTVDSTVYNDVDNPRPCGCLNLAL